MASTVCDLPSPLDSVTDTDRTALTSPCTVNGSVKRNWLPNGSPGPAYHVVKIPPTSEVSRVVTRFAPAAGVSWISTLFTSLVGAKAVTKAWKPPEVRLAVTLRITGPDRAIVTDAVGAVAGVTSTMPGARSTRRKLMAPATVPDWYPIWFALPNIATVLSAATVKFTVRPPLANWIMSSPPPRAFASNVRIS